MIDLLLLGGASVPVHGVQGLLEEVVHGLETAALELRQNEVEEDDTGPRGAAEEEEGAVAEATHHVGDGGGDAVGHEPLEAEAEGHADGSDACGEDLGGDDVGSYGEAEGPTDSVELNAVREEKC